MTLKIPVIVNRKGQAEAFMIKKPNGEYIHDLDLIFDSFEDNMEDLRLFMAVVDIDLESLFEASNIKAKVEYPHKD